MDGLQDEARLEEQGAAQGSQGTPAQVSGEDGAAESGGKTPKVDNDAVQACKDYEAALKERDARIAELEGEIAGGGEDRRGRGGAAQGDGRAVPEGRRGARRLRAPAREGAQRQGRPRPSRRP